MISLHILYPPDMLTSGRFREYPFAFMYSAFGHCPLPKQRLDPPTVHQMKDNFVIFLFIFSLFCIDIKYLGMWGLV